MPFDSELGRLSSSKPTPFPMRRSSLLLLCASFGVLAFTPRVSAQVELVHDLFPGAEGARPSDLLEFKGTLFFVADDGEQGREIWKTDGITATRISDVSPAGGGNVHILGATSNHFYFTTPDSVWATDGVEVWVLGAIRPYRALIRGAPYQTSFGDAIILKASTEEHGLEPWVLENGSARLLADISPAAMSSLPDDFRQVGEFVYFLAGESCCGRENRIWWRTDGTEIAPVRGTPPLGADMVGIAGYDGRLYFSAITPEHGREVWVAEGLQAQLAADLYPGPEGSQWWFGGAEQYGGELFFFDWGNFTLWVTDGAGFREVDAFDPIPPGSFYTTVNFLGQAQGSLVAVRCEWNQDGGGLCYVLRGNGYEFAEVGEVATPDEGVWALSNANSRAFFFADSEETGIELWELRDDEIHIVADLYPGPFRGLYGAPVSIGGRLYFPGNDGVSGVELWGHDLATTESETDAAQPTATGFTALYPNPARGAVQAQYALGASQVVTLELIDLLGRRVRSVEIGRQAAGAHDVRIDTGGLRPGLYVLRLRGDAGAEAMRRIVVVR